MSKLRACLIPQNVKILNFLSQKSGFQAMSKYKWHIMMMMMIMMRTIGMMMMTMTMGAQSGARLPSDGRAGKKLPLRLKSSPSLLINIMRMTKMVTRVRMN